MGKKKRQGQESRTSLSIVGGLGESLRAVREETGISFTALVTAAILAFLHQRAADPSALRRYVGTAMRFRAGKCTLEEALEEIGKEKSGDGN